MAQLKIQVLAISPIETGKNRTTGADWYRRSLQCFTGEIVGQIPYYEDKEVLDNLTPGYYMVDLEPRAGDRGRLEFVIGKATPVANTKASS